MVWFLNLFNNVVFQTVISGTGVFILSQIILKFILDPLQKYKTVISKIDYKLKFYSDVITSPGSQFHPFEKREKCRNDLRDLFCDLQSAYNQIWPKPLFAREKVIDAIPLIIRIHNNLTNNESCRCNHSDLISVRKYLGIRDPEFYNGNESTSILKKITRLFIRIKK